MNALVQSPRVTSTLVICHNLSRGPLSHLFPISVLAWLCDSVGPPWSTVCCVRRIQFCNNVVCNIWSWKLWSNGLSGSAGSVLKASAIRCDVCSTCAGSVPVWSAPYCRWRHFGRHREDLSLVAYRAEDGKQLVRIWWRSFSRAAHLVRQNSIVTEEFEGQNRSLWFLKEGKGHMVVGQRTFAAASLFCVYTRKQHWAPLFRS